MLRFITILFVFSVCFVYRCIAYLEDIWSILILRKHKKNIAQYEGSATSTGQSRRVAVIAIFPSDESMPFTQNLLTGLLANHFHVITLSNRTLTPFQKQAILPHCHALIERHNVGRDIGAYQHGIRLLSEQGMLEKADWLILANDSLYYPKNIQHVISEMLEKAHPFQSLFENFDERHYHAQSFFLLFGKEMFLSKAFQHFWKAYFPSSTRPHSIDEGEVGITKTLKKINHLPRAYYISSYITNSIRQITEKETMNNMPVSNMLFDLYLPDAYTGLLNDQSLPIYRRKAIYMLERMLNQLNPVTGPPGLAISYILHAPLKRDLFYRRIFDLFQILQYAGGFTPEELIAMEDDLRKKGRIEKGSIFKKALLARGYL